MSEGFYSMPRGWMDHPVFGSVKRNPFSRRDAWVWLVEHAAWKPTKATFGGRDYDLKPGEQVRSIRHLVGAWGWDTTKVARFVSALQSSGHITAVAGTGGTLISICQYGEIVRSTRAGDTPDAVPPAHSPDSDRHGREKGRKILSPSEANASSGDSVADAMAAIWIELCGNLHKPIVHRLGKDRIAKLKARLKDTFSKDIEQWRACCERVRRAPMLNGTKTDWHATLDWVLEPRNLRKVIEGQYDERPSLTVVESALSPALPEPTAEEMFRPRLAFYRDKGRWIPKWGPPPTDAACNAPYELLAEFGYRPKGGQSHAVR